MIIKVGALLRFKRPIQVYNDDRSYTTTANDDLFLVYRIDQNGRIYLVNQYDLKTSSWTKYMVKDLIDMDQAELI